MKKLNYRNILIIILMGVASIGIIKDFITLMNGYTYTWVGLFMGVINIVIVGKCLDQLRG